MFRRKKKDTGEVSGAPEEAPAPSVEADAPPAPEPVATESSDGDRAAAEVPAEAAAEAPPGGGERGPGYVDDRLPPRVWVESVLDTRRPPPSREELERQAAADFEAAIAPSLTGLREAVPEASSPEEARSALEERQGEPLPDPEGDLLRGKDIFRREASVHYRVQRHLERPKGRVGWGRPWEPPPGLARPAHDSGRRSLPRGGG